jgi:hypothetical protein
MERFLARCVAWKLQFLFPKLRDTKAKLGSKDRLSFCVLCIQKGARSTIAKGEKQPKSFQNRGNTPPREDRKEMF